MRVCALELCYQHEFACHKGRESLFLFYIGVCWTPVCHGASVHAQKTTLLSFSVSIRHAFIMLDVQITRFPVISQ